MYFYNFWNHWLSKFTTFRVSPWRITGKICLKVYSLRLIFSFHFTVETQYDIIKWDLHSCLYHWSCSFKNKIRATINHKNTFYSIATEMLSKLSNCLFIPLCTIVSKSFVLDVAFNEKIYAKSRCSSVENTSTHSYFGQCFRKLN